MALRTRLERPADARRRALRVVPVLVTAAVVAALAASLVWVGAQRRADVSPQPSFVQPSVLQPSYVPSPSLVLDPALLGWQRLDTRIGALSWAQVTPRVRPDSLFPNEGELMPGIYETPNGFATITSVDYERGSFTDGYKESADGLAWHEAPVPVPGAGPFEHLFVGAEHWIWSVRESRAWRSSDYIEWSEVDLAAIAPPPSPVFSPSRSPSSSVWMARLSSSTAGMSSSTTGRSTSGSNVVAR
jgi:hypothetical protein